MTSLSIKKALLSISLLPLISFSSANAVDLDSCASIDKCIQRIYEVAEPPKSSFADKMSEEEWAVAKRIRRFGDEAVDRLSHVLGDMDEAVRAEAAKKLMDAISSESISNEIKA